MPTTTEEPLHPQFAEHDAAREEFLAEAAQVFEDRRAPINPIADKLSSATQKLPEQKPVKSDAASSRPPASQEAASPQSATDNGTPAKVGKISGPPQPENAAAEASASATQPAVVDPDADIPGPDEYKGGKGFVENWKKLHGARERWKNEALTLKQQLEQIQKGQKPNGAPDPETAKHLASIQAERDNLLARLEAVAVEKSPRFEAAFKPRIEAAINLAKSAVGPERSKAIEKVLELPEGNYRDEQLDAMLQEVGGGIRGSKLTQAVAELDRIAAEKQALSSRGSELYKQWQSEEQANYQRQQQERQRQALGAFEEELKGWGSVVNEEDAKVARDVFNGQADLQDAARASLWAVAGPKIASQAMAKDKRIAELEAELSKYRSVQPGKGNATATQPVSDDIPEGTSYSEAIARAVQQAGINLR